MDLPTTGITLFTDASTSFGAGAWYDNEAIQFSWNDIDHDLLPKNWSCKEAHTNVLELLAIYVAL